MPSRIGRFTLQISGEFVSEASLARDIIGQAKAICTVSNTLNAEINLALKN
jgi:organic hydroperoxide reductase OsmC/OhrA